MHLFLLILFVFNNGFTYKSGSILVETQTTGFLNTNCYLVYENSTNEAILIDPGDDVNTLINHIEENNLELKYIFFTHCHPDHMYGVLTMNLKEKYPNTRFCFTEEGYNDMFEIVANWRNVYPEYIKNMISSSSDAMEVFDMDYSKIGKPDIFVEDGQTFTLGGNKLTAIKTPGHARGSICLYMQNYLFTGDELMRGKVGSTTNSPIASFEKQVQSVRNLYNTFPDETIIYPGHGESSTIGFEKTGNGNITLDKVVQR